MSSKTENYKLTLPAQEDFYDVDVFNDNNVIIDEELKKHSDKLDSLGAAIPKGAKVYTVNSDTFTANLTMGGYPYKEIHSCSGRSVYVGLLSDTYKSAAESCGLFLYGASSQQGAVGIQVKTLPENDIKVVVVDIGAFVSDEDNGRAVVINGLV